MRNSLFKSIQKKINQYIGYDEDFDLEEEEEEIELPQLPASTITIIEPVNYFLDEINKDSFRDAIKGAMYSFNFDKLVISCKMGYSSRTPEDQMPKVNYGISVVAKYLDNSSSIVLDSPLFSIYDNMIIDEKNVMIRENYIILLEGFANFVANYIQLNFNTINIEFEHHRIQDLIPDKYIN